MEMTDLHIDRTYAGKSGDPRTILRFIRRQWINGRFVESDADEAYGNNVEYEVAGVVRRCWCTSFAGWAVREVSRVEEAA